jgi:DNA modification methylase
VDYHKASDFMSKWEMPTGDYWEKWFKEAHRVLKNGGWLIMFGIDRQLLLFKYYALLAGFEEQQSLYWYFISNFPKATDLSKMLDKNAGVDREAIAPSQNARPKSLKEDNLYEAGTVGKEFDITAPSTDLAKKYDGYKYSISPLKQTNETIMIFKKPSKTGSVLHDTLAFENGDTTINVSALDIDGNRVAIHDLTPEQIKRKYTGNNEGNNSVTNNFGVKQPKMIYESTLDGRYPAQTFIDNQVAEILDEQSGFSKGAATVNKYGSPSGSGIYAWNNTDEKPSENIKVDGYDDIGGASKILHKCNYEQDDVTLYHYEPKVSGSERNAGLGGFVDKQYSHDGRDKPIENAYQRNDSIAKNNHPTLKPIDLNYRILKLFKLPTDQKICYPFAGSGSEIIGGIKAGFENWVGCEINAEYVAIANARINYWKETMWEQQSLFDEVI